MLYIFDIDGTVSDASHRLHFIKNKPANWNAFFEACEDDLPIPETIAILRALQLTGHTIVLSTGRSEAIRDKTKHWLAEYLPAPVSGLYMRTAGDYREDTIVKEELLDKIIYDWNQPIGGAFEDRQQCVDMYRKRGIRVFQVAEGNF